MGMDCTCYTTNEWQVEKNLTCRGRPSTHWTEDLKRIVMNWMTDVANMR